MRRLFLMGLIVIWAVGPAWGMWWEHYADHYDSRGFPFEGKTALGGFCRPERYLCRPGLPALAASYSPGGTLYVLSEWFQHDVLVPGGAGTLHVRIWAYPTGFGMSDGIVGSVWINGSRTSFSLASPGWQWTLVKDVTMTVTGEVAEVAFTTRGNGPLQIMTGGGLWWEVQTRVEAWVE